MYLKALRSSARFFCHLFRRVFCVFNPQNKRIFRRIHFSFVSAARVNDPPTFRLVSSAPAYSILLLARIPRNQHTYTQNVQVLCWTNRLLVSEYWKCWATLSEFVECFMNPGALRSHSHAPSLSTQPSVSGCVGPPPSRTKARLSEMEMSLGEGVLVRGKWDAIVSKITNALAWLSFVLGVIVFCNENHWMCHRLCAISFRS